MTASIMSAPQNHSACQLANVSLMAMYAAGKIKPHIHATYPLERAAEALNEVLNKRVSGKVVLTT